MREHVQDFARRGVQLAAVAQGTGEEAARFCAPLETGYPCLGDPGKVAYRGFGLARDRWWNLLVTPFLENAPRAWRRLRNASLAGSAMPHSDVKQLGGLAILDRRGVVRHLHRAQRSDDLPPMSQVLAELDRLSLV